MNTVPRAFYPIPAANTIPRVTQTLAASQNIDGGFGGGYGQDSHVATSYAAILSLAMVGGAETLKLVDRKAM